MLKNSPHIRNFEEVLSNAATLALFDEAIQKPEVEAKINEHCPNIKNEPIHCADNVKKGIKDAGKFLGETLKTLGGYISVGINKAGNYFEGKIDETG